MRRILKTLGGILSVILLLVAAVVVLAVTSDSLGIHLPVEQTEYFDHEGLASFPATLHVEGNQLVTASGEVVRLRGLMPGEPYEIEDEKRFNRDLAEDQLGSLLVRRRGRAAHGPAGRQEVHWLWRIRDGSTGARPRTEQKHRKEAVG